VARQRKFGKKHLGQKNYGRINRILLFDALCCANENREAVENFCYNISDNFLKISKFWRIFQDVEILKFSLKVSENCEKKEEKTKKKEKKRKKYKKSTKQVQKNVQKNVQKMYKKKYKKVQKKVQKKIQKKYKKK